MMMTKFQMKKKWMMIQKNLINNQTGEMILMMNLKKMKLMSKRKMKKKKRIKNKFILKNKSKNMKSNSLLLKIEQNMFYQIWHQQINQNSLKQHKKTSNL